MVFFAVEFPVGYGFYVLGDRILIGYVFEKSHIALDVFIHMYICLYRYIHGYSPALKNELSLAIYQL